MPIRVRVNVNLSGKAAAARPRVTAAVEKAAYDIEAHAKSGAPVDTGFLRAAIQAEPAQAAAIGDTLQAAGASNADISAATAGMSSLHWTVTSYASYSAYQEFGTRLMRAQPFMTPAAELVRPQLRRAVAMAVI